MAFSYTCSQRSQTERFYLIFWGNSEPDLLNFVALIAWETRTADSVLRSEVPGAVCDKEVKDNRQLIIIRSVHHSAQTT